MRLLHKRLKKNRQCDLLFSLVLLILALPTLSTSTKANTSSSSSIQFTQPQYTVRIPENSLGKVNAIPDTRMGIQLNQTQLSDIESIRFRIRSGDSEGFFKAESERVGDFVFLILRTKTSNLNVLNRERTPNYALDIRARIRYKGGIQPEHIRGSKRSQNPKTLVHVEVTDTNDLDPFFQPSRYVFNVPEDTPLHTSIGRVKAEDADEGINGEIYYSLKSPNDFFAVDPFTGIVSLTRPVRKKENESFRLAVIAQDRGAKPVYAVRRADTARVDIKVVEVRV